MNCFRCGAPVDRPASIRDGTGCAHESFCDDCTDRNLAEAMTLKGFDWKTKKEET